VRYGRTVSMAEQYRPVGTVQLQSGPCFARAEGPELGPACPRSPC